MSDMPPPQKPSVEVKKEFKTEAEKWAEIKRLDELIKKTDPATYKRYVEPYENLKDSEFIISIGQVIMRAPRTWKSGVEQNNRVAADHYEDYMIDGDKDATVSFFYRGRRTSSDSGERFKELLKKPPHELTQEEFDSMRQTMRRIDSDFTKTAAKTTDINGKRVLLLEGNVFKGTKDEGYVRSIYIDSDGTGTAVQEIFFQAPPAKYKQHLKEFEAALKTIHWK